MKTTLEKKVIISVGVLFVLIIVLLFTIIMPTIRQIQKMNSDTETLLSYLETKYENAKNLRASIKKAQEIKEEVIGFEKYLFQKGDELRLITSLENIASQNDLAQKIESSNLDNITGQYADMTIVLTGGYDKILKYLSDLEKNEYFININKLYLTPIFDRTTNKIGDNANLRLSISIYVNK